MVMNVSIATFVTRMRSRQSAFALPVAVCPNVGLSDSAGQEEGQVSAVETAEAGGRQR